MLTPEQRNQFTSTETDANPLQLAAELRKLFRQLDQFGEEELILAQNILQQIAKKIDYTKQPNFKYLFKKQLSTNDERNRENYNFAGFRIQKVDQSLDSLHPLDCLLFLKETDLINHQQNKDQLPPLYYFYWVPNVTIIFISKGLAQRESTFIEKSSVHYREETTYYRRPGF